MNCARIVRPSRALLRRAAAVAVSLVAWVAAIAVAQATAEASEAAWVAVWAVVWAVVPVPRSSCPTSVVLSRHFPFFLADSFLASLHCRLAGSQGSFPSGW